MEITSTPSAAGKVQRCPPGATDQGHARQSEEKIEPGARPIVFGEEVAGQQSQADADNEAEEVRANIGILPLAAEESQQRQGCCQWQVPATTQALPVMHEVDGGEEPDSTKDRGRSTDRLVTWRLHPGIDQIADGAAGQDQTPGEPGAEGAAQKDDEESADRQIAEEVEAVRMQGQGGDRAPPFAVANGPGIGVATTDPVAGGEVKRGEIELDEVVEDGDQEKHREGHKEVVGLGRGRRQGRRPMQVLFFKVLELVQRQGEVIGWDQELPAAAERFDPAGDLPCFQGQRPEPRLAGGQGSNAGEPGEVRRQRAPLLLLEQRQGLVRVGCLTDFGLFAHASLLLRCDQIHPFRLSELCLKRHETS